MSLRERELNKMMNRIKDILSKARKEVIENEKFLSLIVESVSTGIIILNERNQIMTTNRATNQILGMPVFTHLNQLANIDDSFPVLFRDLTPTDTKSIKIVNEREEFQVSLRASTITLKSGAMKIITLSSIGSELEAKEMESWVKLIRVMTHEIMNSIAPITSLTDTLLFAYISGNSRNLKYGESNDSDNSDDDELRANTIEAFQTINSTAKGLLNFVNSYRKFTGIPVPQLKEIRLYDLIEQIVSLETEELKKKNIEIEVILKDKNLVVNIDESQIIQVLVNLLKNAIEAIEKSYGDKLIISAGKEHDIIYLDVANNAEPVPKDILPNIFIPFFTTKDTGTGIGLSVSRYIMRLHGGNLKHFVDCNMTVFRMIFRNDK
jgi:nitrogen fixation/metabolism regulation signal transduction histidine kinase